MSASTSPRSDPKASDSEAGQEPFPALPTETEIYILPDGRVIVADLPLELAPLAQALGGEPGEARPRP